MTTIGMLAAVAIKVAAYGDEVTFDSGSVDVQTLLPGWIGAAPKAAYRLTNAWTQDESGITGTYRFKFLKDIDLECLGLVFHVDAASTVGRTWEADGKVRTVPEKLGGTGFGSGRATRVTLPAANGETLVAEFPEPAEYRAQDPCPVLRRRR